MLNDTPVDVLPYFFAVEPAPADARSAFAIAKPVADGSGVGVSIVLEDQTECAEIFRFSRLGFVKIAWSPDGRHVAFSQDSTLMVRDRSGTLQLTSFAEDVRWLGFDRRQRLWCLVGRRLEVRLADGVTTAIGPVDSVAVSDVAAYCRREEAGLCVYVHDGDTERRLACLTESLEHATADLSMRGNYLIVVLGSTTVGVRARARIVRFDLATSKTDTVLDEHVAFGFNGGPAISAVALSTGGVLAGYETGLCTQVWSVVPGARPRPISPAGFEVFDFALDASENRLAIVASDTRSPEGASQRQLLVAEREGAEWRFAAPVRGVYDMPRWRYDGGLEVLCGDNGRWTRRIRAPREAGPVAHSAWCDNVRVSKGSIEYDVMRLPGPHHRKAGIILLPRFHQQFVAGAQSFFFHHLLFSIARRLGLLGYSVVVLSGPGAIGRGRSRRATSASYVVELRSAIDDVVQSLTAEGCRSLGIFGGSLAAVPALRLLGPGTPFSACAFVAPLLESSIPVTVPVNRYLLDDPAVEPLCEAAAKLAVPVLAVYGARDEVVPPAQIAELRNRVGNAALVEVCVLGDEGHIFKQVESWRRAQRAIETFFASHLAAAPTAAEA